MRYGTTRQILRAAYAATAAAAAMMLCGCFKKVTTDTTVVIKALLQETSGGDNVPVTGVTAYAYYTGSENWTINSYEDAVNRIITSTEDGSQRNEPDAEGSPYEKYESGNYTSMWLNASPAMIVVVDPQSQMYAYMFKYLNAENLPETFLTLIFHTWKTEPYKEGTKEGQIWNVFPPAGASGGEGGEEGGEEGGDGSGNDDGSGSGSSDGTEGSDDGTASQSRR